MKDDANSNFPLGQPARVTKLELWLEGPVDWDNLRNDRQRRIARFHARQREEQLLRLLRQRRQEIAAIPASVRPAYLKIHQQLSPTIHALLFGKEEA